MDEKTFLAFIDALMRDNVDSIDEWENGTIEDFLESAHAWAIDSTCSPHYTKSKNPWKRCADILYGGKIYE